MVRQENESGTLAKWEPNATASASVSYHLKGLHPPVACKLKVGHPLAKPSCRRWQRGCNDVWAESVAPRICIMVEKMQTWMWWTWGMSWASEPMLHDDYTTLGWVGWRECTKCSSVVCRIVSSQPCVRKVLVLHLFCRSESKMWSPLSSEGGKTHPYKMNLASEPKVCVWFLSHSDWIQGKSYLQVAKYFLEARTFLSHCALKGLWVFLFYSWQMPTMKSLFTSQQEVS